MKKTIAVVAICLGMIAATGCSNKTDDKVAPPAPTETVDTAQQGQIEHVTVQGMIEDVNEDKTKVTVVDGNGSQTIFNVDGQTALSEGLVLEKGTPVSVEYNGILTRSLPPQGSALKITGSGATTAGSTGKIKPVEFVGTIEEVSADKSQITVKDNSGNVTVFNVTSDTTVLEGVSLEKGNYIDVQYNGVLTKSIPPQGGAIFIQPGAAKIENVTVRGTIDDISEDKSRITLKEGNGNVTIFNVSNETVVEDGVALEKGKQVSVEYGGVLAMSYPAQGSALKISK